jgi:hypothetical protein
MQAIAQRIDLVTLQIGFHALGHKPEKNIAPLAIEGQSQNKQYHS